MPVLLYTKDDTAECTFLAAYPQSTNMPPPRADSVKKSLHKSYAGAPLFTC